MFDNLFAAWGAVWTGFAVGTSLLALAATLALASAGAWRRPGEG